MKRFLACLAIFFMTHYACAQDSTSLIHSNKRLKKVVYGSTALYGMGIIGMNHLWYQNSPQSSFHFFNDNKEWLQVDKAGHFYTAYQLSRSGVEVMKWTGMNEKKAYFWGSMIGVIYQTPIEILDGFSSEFGASWGDLVANTLGSSLLYSQYMVWDEIRIAPKYSFTSSPYPSQRPNTLGSNLAEKLLKDYNAQTYWLSGNIKSFSKNDNLPPWLNIALGYGGEEMLYAFTQDNKSHGLNPYRQYYLSLDVDLTRIKTKHKVLKTLFFVFNTIKIPFPAIEYSQGNLKYHWIKF